MDVHQMDVDVDEVVVQQPVPRPDPWQTPIRMVSPPPRPASVPLIHPNTDLGFVYSAEMMSHNPRYTQNDHPEVPGRISSIWDELVRLRMTGKAKRIPIRPVVREEAVLVHSQDLWDKIEAFQLMDMQNYIDTAQYYEQLSLYICESTTRSARLSCGGVIEAALAVARGELKKSFAIVRPPGHHAEPEEHMGFCFFNNVAVAARVVQQKTPLKKILILDWDVHHGNGTQRAFNEDPSVLYISIHRYERGEFYPCGPFGALQSVGEGPGRGYSVNIPWPTGGMGDADYLHAFQKIVMPIAMEFAPDLVIISAGFDAARGDHLGECDVTPDGYAHMTYMLASLASGRLVVALEGGYNLQSITHSAVAVTKILLGESPPALKSMVASEAAAETVWLVAKEQSKYWKSVSPKSCEPQQEVASLSFSVPEILKLHRQYYLYTTHDMMQIPLVGKELEDRFSAQVMCTTNIFDKETMVFIMHEFGNLRAEMSSSLVCDVQIERSYLLDFSKDLIHWAQGEGYSVLDVNLFPKPVDQQLIAQRLRIPTDEYQQKLVTYLWDNYVQLCSAKNIILIGHGPACSQLIELINLRATSVMKCVKAVVQVIGYSTLRAPKNNHELREWFRKRSFVAIPATHPVWTPDPTKEMKKHGRLQRFDVAETGKLMLQSFPLAKDFVKQRMLATAEDDDDD
ncbi:hypothetical protein HMN09_01375100 [Mycena chlorophos]|uniref:histone deacetylase n=1 Tax=Mycena chlorophos TaxID=658473 RepID=A0A8H6VQV7_MYCCL|nr:hypothetical protein HMN09_01375100 [Mycena chlorophos]